jgi:hypothetical protein
MILDLFPLCVVKCSWFIQDVRVDGDLSNVMQECRPTQSVSIDLWQFHLLSDEVGVHSHALTVAARQTIVHIQCAGEHEDLLRGDDGRVAHPAFFRLLDSSCEVASTSSLARNGHPLRRLVRENQSQFQQHGERQQSTG